MALARDTKLAVDSPLIVEKLSAPSLPATDAAKCTQCGKTMRQMAMFLKNITCRDCYGLERYGRAPSADTTPNNPLLK
ncbi:MAG TPA: hypothetical protein VGB45_11415 [Abditibacterium sp.]|jgi:hypothetical protein